ncbi:Protease 4 [Clarias magur]|uniref:Protease 4 n=1 Tax=Clarias magur TaxID=1594786 RepID=A0A8J4XB38_CLAMG|nr:Protease 4 [Clarias magur]
MSRFFRSSYLMCCSLADAAVFQHKGTWEGAGGEKDSGMLLTCRQRDDIEG